MLSLPKRLGKMKNRKILETRNFRMFVAQTLARMEMRA